MVNHPFEPQDVRTELWGRLERFLTERRDALREHNDKRLSMEDTMMTRGRIAELNDLR